MVCLSNYYFGASYALFQYLFFIFLFIPQLSVKRQTKAPALASRGNFVSVNRCQLKTIHSAEDAEDLLEEGLDLGKESLEPVE